MTATRPIPRSARRPAVDQRTPLPLNFRPDIEGLRGVAILLVVGFHAALPGVPGGFVGVDVFFVLSGYLITALVHREHERDGRISVTEFYARRVRRLLPASALTLFATVLAAMWIYSPLEQADLASTARAVGAYGSNIWFAQRATDYLGPRADTNPFLHTWSLAAEEQFYLLWPAALVLALAATRSRGARVPLGVVAVLVLASFGLSQWLLRVNPPWAFFSSPSRAWEFGVGALAYLAPRTTPLVIHPRWRTALLVAGVTGVGSSAVAFSRGTAFPGVAALLPVLGTAAVLMAGADGGEGHQRSGAVLRARPLQFLGRHSYSWYLWHWPALVMAAATFGPLTLPARLACLALSLGVAVIAHGAVESRIRYAPWLVRRPRTTLALAAALTALAVGGAWAWRRGAARLSEEGDQRVFALARADVPSLYDTECAVDLGAIESPSCAFADVSSATTVVLFGDSFAMQWYPALLRIAQDRHWRLVVLTKAHCPSVDARVFNLALMRYFDECDRWRETAFERIASLRPLAVVLASSTIYSVAADGTRPIVPVAPSEWAAGQARTLRRVASTGARAILVRETPWPGFDAPACLARVRWHGGDPRRACAFDRTGSVDAMLLRSQTAAVDAVPGAALVDLTDAICPETRCSTFRNGVVVFRDYNHLTASFAESLSDTLSRRLQKLLGGG